MEKTPDSHGFPTSRGDRRASELAEQQAGRVSLAQLRDAGLGDGAVEYRVRTGRLHREHQGVFAVGHRAATPRGRLWGAVLASGGVLSHRAAAALWDLTSSYGRRIAVTTPGSGRSTGLIVVHHAILAPPEIREIDGLPVTSPMRALLDMAATESPYRVERLVHRAAHLDLLDASYDPAGRRGAKRLRDAIATLEHRPPQITRSELEERFLKLVHDAGLPPPLVNHRRGQYTSDFVWPGLALIVETDGARTHNNDAAFVADRRRDVNLKLQGWDTLRFTWHDVVRHPGWVVGALSSFAAARANARRRS